MSAQLDGINTRSFLFIQHTLAYQQVSYLSYLYNLKDLLER